VRGKIQKRKRKKMNNMHSKLIKTERGLFFNQVIRIMCLCEKRDFLNKIVDLCVEKESYGEEACVNKEISITKIVDLCVNNSI
jgi:hypothetical protein